MDDVSEEGIRFSKEILGISGSIGLNAMTISDLTGIPRPTVIRKLRKLEKDKFILKNKLNLYSIDNSERVSTDIENMRLKNLNRISSMICKLLNTARLNQQKN